MYARAFPNPCSSKCTRDNASCRTRRRWLSCKRKILPELRASLWKIELDWYFIHSSIHGACIQCILIASSYRSFFLGVQCTRRTWFLQPLPFLDAEAASGTLTPPKNHPVRRVPKPIPRTATVTHQPCEATLEDERDAMSFLEVSAELRGGADRGAGRSCEAWGWWEGVRGEEMEEGSQSRSIPW